MCNLETGEATQKPLSRTRNEKETPLVTEVTSTTLCVVMANKVAVLLGATVCAGLAGVQMLEKRQREEEERAADRAKQAREERQREAFLQDEDKVRKTLLGKINYMKVDLRYKILAAEMLREIGENFVKKETDCGLKLPFLKTPGAADSAGEIVFAVGLALGLEERPLGMFHEFPCDPGAHTCITHPASCVRKRACA